MTESTEDRINRLALESNAATILCQIMVDQRGEGVLAYTDTEKVEYAVKLAKMVRKEVYDHV